MTRPPSLLILFAGFVLFLMSTPTAAQRTRPSLDKHASNGSTSCEFGQPDYAATCEHASGANGWFGSLTRGAYGESYEGNFGYLGAQNGGTYGEHANGNFGFLGYGSYGALGRYYSNGSYGNYGYLGGEDYGVYGTHNSTGNFGYLGGNAYGAYGEHNTGAYGFLGGYGYGAFGHTNGNFGYLGAQNGGTYGEHANGNIGQLGSSNYGAYGTHDNGNRGNLGSSDYGAYGEHANGHWGYLGGNSTGVQGRNTNGNFGILGSNNYAVRGYAANGFAGYFQGDVHIIGTLTGGAAASKVDHPLDPENQYLVHSAVESPDMMNVYNGNVTTDAQGFATIALPTYFEALNRDFRYQLTVIGTFAQAIIAEKIQDNRFVIRTDQPGVEVSWQVTGIRQDRWAEAYRLVVEQAKPAEERGYYLHPALYGQPEERGVEWGRDPEEMRAMQEVPQQREKERRRMEQEHRQIEQEHERLQAERERIQAERAQRPPRPDNQR